MEQPWWKDPAWQKVNVGGGVETIVVPRDTPVWTGLDKKEYRHPGRGHPSKAWEEIVPTERIKVDVGGISQTNRVPSSYHDVIKDIDEKVFEKAGINIFSFPSKSNKKHEMEDEGDTLMPDKNKAKSKKEDVADDADTLHHQKKRNRRLEE